MSNAPDHGWGHLLQKEPQACKVRLARLFKKPEQSMVEVMNELKQLTEKDMEDFKVWFTAAGYPCT